eukprot:2077629-Rhodomonas_salina.1
MAMMRGRFALFTPCRNQHIRALVPVRALIPAHTRVGTSTCARALRAAYRQLLVAAYRHIGTRKPRMLRRGGEGQYQDVGVVCADQRAQLHTHRHAPTDSDRHR